MATSPADPLADSTARQRLSRRPPSSAITSRSHTREPSRAREDPRSSVRFSAAYPKRPGLRTPAQRGDGEQDGPDDDAEEDRLPRHGRAGSLAGPAGRASAIVTTTLPLA